MRRQGAQATRRQLVHAAHRRGASWIFMLENDWRSVRAFPWALFREVEANPQIYSLRLYGAFKEAGGTRPCFTQHQGLPGRPRVTWTPLSASEPAETALIHYGSPPNVTRIAESLVLHAARTDSEAGRVSGTIRRLTARVVQNVVEHIGADRTPAFVA
jgi:hypothetical protein